MSTICDVQMQPRAVPSRAVPVAAMLAKCSAPACSTLVFGSGLCVDCEKQQPVAPAGDRRALYEQGLRTAIVRKVGRSRGTLLTRAAAPPRRAAASEVEEARP